MSTLFSPLQIKSLTFANRVFVAPMCQYSAVDGVVGDWHTQHLGALAVGGAGALTIEATAVAADGRITAGCLGLYKDAQEAELASLVRKLHGLSTAKIGIQLSHSGRKGSCHKPWEGGAGVSPEAGGWTVLGPTAIPFGADRPTPQAMDEPMMAQVVEAFTRSAARADRAGIDYLEVHLAHGYLLHSFLSPISNRRQDCFGGTLENRMRFPLEVITRVRAAWPEGKPLGVRINSHDWSDGGIEFHETLEVCRRLKEVGVDFVCISAGAVVEGVRIPAAPGYLVSFAAQVKAAVGLKTRVVGGLDDCELAEKTIATQQADCVAIGRAMLLDPRWALKAGHRLGSPVSFPNQYLLCSPQRWQGANL